MSHHEPRAPLTEQSFTARCDLAPLSVGQLWALARAAARHLLAGLPRGAQELRLWHARAMAMPNVPLRVEAVEALTRKRTQAEGAVLFTILQRRDAALLRTLLCYQVIWDYLDSVHEQQPDLSNGLRLHGALIEALDPDRPISDHYKLNREKDDAGHLAALTRACRDQATRLASYAVARPLLIEEARGSALALSINHDPDRRRRTANMRRWAATRSSGAPDASWFELAAAAAAALAVFAMLAEAVDRSCDQPRLLAARAAYVPWVCVVATMLDSYADRDEDMANGQHIYFDYYPSPAHATARIGHAIQEGLRHACRLPHGHEHLVLIASMIAMYLTRDSARTQNAISTTRSLAAQGGSLTRVLMPVLRAWRTAYGLQES